jgi:phage recombination protein Bet
MDALSVNQNFITMKRTFMNNLSYQKNSHQFTAEQIDLLKKTVAKACGDDELKLFFYVCDKTKLDPFMKQIYAIKRSEKMVIQTSIDGLRLIADRSGNYSPGREPTFSYDKDGKVLSATAYLKKRTADGTWHEVSATAFFSEYKPKFESSFWRDMPHVMLSKCAEALALRKAFPAEMSGLYSDAEMAQSGEEDPLLEIAGLTPLQIEEIMDTLQGDEGFAQRILAGYEVKDFSKIPQDQFAPIMRKLRKVKGAA